MNRYILLLAVLFTGVFILNGCSDDNTNNNHNEKNENTVNNHENVSASQKQNDDEDNKNDEAAEDMVIKTDDDVVTFTLKNEIDASKGVMESLKERVLDAYNIVERSIETPYTPQDEINIYFETGVEASTGFNRDITLYAKDIDKYPIIHEMTHTILGYGGKDGKLFDGTRGFLTQEGFAVYLQDEHGFSYTKSGSDALMKILLSENKIFPLERLIKPVPSQRYFRPSARKASPELIMNLSYAHAGSFIHYLIDEFGMDKFEVVYNQEDLSEALEETYDKTVSELEKDWHEHIKAMEDNPTSDNIDAFIEELDQIESNMFK